jgi:para-aminobenzoate synthetase
MQSPARLAERLAARYPRMFWLDGEGGRPWSGRRSMVGFLAEDDVSITFDANVGEVVRHQDGNTEVIGSDPFVCLESEMAKDGPGSQSMWVGYFGYASRPDLPAQVAARQPGRPPDAWWMRVSRPTFVFDHPLIQQIPVETTPGGGPCLDVPAHYLSAFEAVQDELRRGNSYEVNLTYRQRIRSGRPPFRSGSTSTYEQPTRRRMEVTAAPRAAPVELKSRKVSGV